MLSSLTMNFAKCLLVALALWMPAASFAAAVESARRVEHAAPCEAPEGSESEAESEGEENAMLFTLSSAPVARAFEHIVGHDSHSPLDGHIVEMLIPPPNPSAPR